MAKILNTDWLGLESEFQKRVANPFNMKNTRFIKDKYMRIHKVQPYDNDGNWIDKSKSEWWKSRDSVFVAPTTIHSESIDFSKWMIAMMNEEGLSKNGFAELFKPHSVVKDGYLNEKYTLGFSRVSFLGLSDLYAHTGNNTGFSSAFIFDKDRNWGMVFFTNSESGTPFSLNLMYDLLLIGTTLNKILIGIVLLFAIVSVIYLTYKLIVRLIKIVMRFFQPNSQPPNERRWG